MTMTHGRAAALLAGAVLFSAGPAQAQTTSTGTAAQTTGLQADGHDKPDPANGSASANTAATAQPSPPVWSLELSGGISRRDDGPDGSWQTLALSRQIDRAYVRASFMRYRGTLVQSDTALPSTYYVATLGTGANIHNWVFDAWASLGVQDYGRISSALGSRDSTGARHSGYQALGADVGKIIPFAPQWYLTATATGTYAHGKLLRPAPDYSGLVDAETDEPTWSASGMVRVDHAFGDKAQNYLGLSLSPVWSSNAISDISYAADYEAQDTTSFAKLIHSRHIADSWLEFGASANLQVTKSLYLDLFATRTLGARAGNTTNGGLTLRRSF